MDMNDKYEIVVQNPVLPGFHPDPSICKVGDYYYIATSTFEYFPGVAIHKSRNLQDWTICPNALRRKNQLNMDGNPSSGGIWAPCLTHDKGTFYLIYTDVKEWSGALNTQGFKDSHNYLTTAPSIEGPWSDPVYLNSSGFDPSLFHDEDGRKWFVNMIWDYRNWENNFGGIVLQEFDEENGCLTGPIENIFRGTDLKLTEAPHLYKRNGFYYLMTAEGGTSYFHAVTLARSRNINGPYEVHPDKHLLTAVSDRPALEKALSTNDFKNASSALHPGLQKAGHGSMVPWTDDEWILAHLCGRPLENTGRCPLGRETALQKIVWKEDDWPYLDGKGASETVHFPQKKNIRPIEKNRELVSWIENFDRNKWDYQLNTLRNPSGDNYLLNERPGWLRLNGAESPVSRFNQTLLVRRVQHFNWSVETRLDFSPDDFQQFAGLIVRYDETTQLIFRVSDNYGVRSLGIISYDLNQQDLPLGRDEIALDDGPVSLRVYVSGRDLQFSYSQNSSSWKKVGPVFDSSIFSDDYVNPMGFTGTYAGLGAWDVSGRRKSADFEYLKYNQEVVI